MRPLDRILVLTQCRPLEIVRFRDWLCAGRRGDAQYLRAAAIEMAASFVCLKANDIGTKYAVQDLHLRRKEAEEVFLGERNMQKPTDFDPDIHLPSFLSK